MQALDFSRLFDDGKQVSTEQGRVTLERRAVGDLVVPTGKIIASDPFAAPDTEPFSVALPPGKYAVVLSVAHYEEDGDQRVAGAMLRVRPGTAVTWQMAVLPGDDPAELEADEIFGFGVDSGAACLMDADAARHLIEKVDADESYFETMLAEMDKTYVDTWSWANIEMNPATASNLIAFSAGMGDGLYASYFGLDAEGAIVCLITDFALFDAEEMSL